ncbi:sensor histidine kinase [Lentzea sp. NPDC060358]|uniref:sensor histidine kinase n=1 Tax=Lentzea sp. NPDC060358 TaxID=3347103 RepID=UPI0036560703
MAASGERSGGGAGLPQPPGALRRFWRAHPKLVDVLVVCAYLVAGSAWALITPLSSGRWQPAAPWLVSMAGVVLTAGALTVRRSHPWLTFAVATCAAVATMTTGDAIDPQAMALAVYALFVYRSTRDGWAGFAAVVALGVLVRPAVEIAVRGAPLSSFSLSVSGLLHTTVVLVAALLGISVAGRRRYVRTLVDRANQLAHERDQQARIATLAERAGIVREMHDVLSHSLSVMVSLADGAAALAQKDPVRCRDAVRELGGIGRQSLSEMRLLLGALGDEDAADRATGPSLSPSPGIAELDGLLATFRAARMPVRLDVQGPPPSSPGAQNALYRIIQESLTNVLRYARNPRHVTVELKSGVDGTSVTITDDGAAGPRAESVGLGRGIIGIRERAALYGGTAQAGPVPGGGWRVHVDMPQAEGKP